MVNRFIARFGWIISLLLAGIYLLLNNLGVIGPWGDLIWGGLVVAIGLGFLIWFFVDRARWWRVMPGFTLLAAGVVIALESRHIALDNWAGAIVLFGAALAFWALLLQGADFWWAVIPAGVLTVTSLLVGLRAQLPGLTWTALLLFGLGLVFILVYLVRFGQRDTQWASVPGGWLALLGLITLVEALKLPSWLAAWWPVVLVVAAVALLVFAIVRRPRPVAAPASGKIPAAAYDPPVPARGAAVNQLPPPTAEPKKPGGPRPAQEPEIDIYKLIEQQPQGPGTSSGAGAQPGA